MIRLSDLLLDYYLIHESNVFVCGNGSAAISNHFLCDHLKSTSTNTNYLK